MFGIAAAGPADDGAYYQAVVDAAKKLSTDNGFEDPIVVDNIQAADAATAIGDLAQQGVDVIIVGASEIAEPLPDLIAKYPDIFWYCNCGAGFPPNPGLAQSTDDGSEIGYTAGYATGSEAEGEGWRLGRSSSAAATSASRSRPYMSFELGLKAVDPSYTHDLRADRRLPVRLRQHRQRHRGAADRARQRRRRRLPVPRRRPEAGRASGQRRRHHHDERRLVEGLRPTART